jgi:hypothetical protein
MGVMFVGGPFDGTEIDHTLINKYAEVTPINGDLGLRLFVLMPDSREVWERMVRGEKVKPQRLFPYERVLTAGGGFFVASPLGAFDQALLEAKLRIHERAKTALAALPDGDARRVVATAASLLKSPPDQWLKQEVLRLDDEKPVYLLRVTPELRAFVRVTERGEVELFDIVREDTLKLFEERSRDAGAPR